MSIGDIGNNDKLNKLEETVRGSGLHSFTCELHNMSLVLLRNRTLFVASNYHSGHRWE